MKVEVNEHDGCFSFDMAAETVEDAALLARIKMNGKKEVRNISASAHGDGAFIGSVVIGKIRNQRTYVK